MTESKRTRDDSTTDDQDKRQRFEADDDDGIDDVGMGKSVVGFDILKTDSLSSCTFMLLVGELNGKTMAYLSHSPKIYERPFTPTTTTATLIDNMAYNINNDLSARPELIDKTAADLTNINMIIGGGGVIKPDYFRDGFALINNEQNNIHNHLRIDGSQELYHQLKDNLKILPPITFILSDENEDQGAANRPVIDPPDVQVVFSCCSKMLGLSTYWKKWSHTFEIASMNINLNEMNGNDFSWKLDGDKILAAQEMLKQVPEKLNEFNQIVDYVTKRLNNDPSSCSSTSSKSIAPHIEHLNDQYLNVVFLKADVKKCLNEATKYSIEATPVFLFFQHGQEVDRLLSANKESIEETIKKFSKSTPSEEIEYTNLNLFIEEKSCMAINCTGQWQDVVFGTESDVVFGSNYDNPELILHITFNQSVNIYSVAIQASEDNGPKNVKLFINRQTIDFNDAKTSEPVQILEFGSTHLENDLPIELLFDKFQNVHSLSLFFTNNQLGSGQTIIDFVTFFGVLNNTTNKEVKHMPTTNM